jgi:hypothetical protein
MVPGAGLPTDTAGFGAGFGAVVDDVKVDLAGALNKT